MTQQPPRLLRPRWAFTRSCASGSCRGRALCRPLFGALMIVCGAVVGATSAAAAVPAQTSAEADSPIVVQARALQRAHTAVVGVRTLAVEDARSAASLGRAREGSGVVIDADGTVLTIGYLIVEADQVQIVVGADRVVPARVLAYDVATGFGLVQALAPLRMAPVPLGSASSIDPAEPLMVASGGEDGAVSMARLVSRRSFSGYWEYHIDGALFTIPPRADHSGAALINGRGELVGVGSLIVNDALGPEAPRVQGNMFVPVDLLRPILAELRVRGSSQDSARAWIGVNCIESGGQIRVLRVSADSPAEVAGLQPGDRILRIDGNEVAELETLWKRLWAGGAAEREVTLDIRRGEATQTMKLQSVDRMKTLRHSQGI